MDCSQVSKILASETSNTMRLVVSSRPKRFSITEENINEQRKNSATSHWDEKSNGLIQNQYVINTGRATAL